jgi:hypothetical protein
MSLLPIVDRISMRRAIKDRATVGPIISEVHPGDMKNFTRDLDRSSRRKRRHTQRSRRQVVLPDREALKTHRTRVPSIFDPVEVVRERSLEAVDGDSEEDKDPLRLQFQKQRHLFSGKLPANRTFGAGGVQPKDIAEKERERELAGVVVEVKEGWKCGNCGVGEKNTPIKRNGPQGEETLCNSCGVFYLQTGELDPSVNGSGVSV